MRDGDAGQHPRRAQVEPGQLLRLLSCVVLVCGAEVAALADFSGYLTKLLQNHTAYACDGQHLSLHCPRHSTISVQSAFYGQDPHMCSAWEPETRMTEPRNCVAPTSLQLQFQEHSWSGSTSMSSMSTQSFCQTGRESTRPFVYNTADLLAVFLCCHFQRSCTKVLDECQNLRSCQLLVNSRVFGPDLCPGTTKFLLVSFKCKPTEYKTKSACENQELKLHCQESKFLIIYSATYGRWAHEESVCSTKAEHTPPFDCLSYTALEVLSKRCYGKQRCKITVSSRDFGSPCLPGVTKYLNVSYACVPKFILTAVNPLVPDNKSSVKQNNGVDLDPRESRLPKKDGTIVSSNYLATFAYIKDHLERAALLFVSSVCVGLILTLCALVICVLCPSDIQKLHRKRDQLVPESARAYESSEQEEEEEEEDSSLSNTQDETDGLYRPCYSGYNSAEAAELAERIERREQIIQEIWMSSGLDMTPPRNMNTFYINEQ
ncbi:protein eva-1 homolog C isoform X2 [Poecile atricapillus]|uniref:protein eva-1 homolog C isoform X2 n=1 Tax=Poecile atricapillus TaxID=48891 RepID=UPI00273A4AB8|nr:protein eva-1 homolog C isoform X2 [Poecile atricapillus]